MFNYEIEMPRCPNCLSETEELYQDPDNNIVGCPECIKTIDAFDWESKKEENELADIANMNRY